MSEIVEQPNVVIDLGSSMMKAGYSNEASPSALICSFLARPKYNKILSNELSKDIIGPDKSLRGLYQLEKLIERGKFVHASDLKKVMGKILEDMDITSEVELPLFFTEPIFTSSSTRASIADTLLLDRHAGKLAFGTQGVLSLFALGKTDGVVLSSGAELTQVTSVSGGLRLDHGCTKIEFGGNEVSVQLKSLLRSSGHSIDCSNELLLFDEMKKSVVEAVLMSADEQRFQSKAQLDLESRKKQNEIKYELPDGNEIVIKSERFSAVEILFNPAQAGYEFQGLHELLDSSLKNLDLDLRKLFYKNIFLSGGNTMITGFPERLSQEMEALMSDKNLLGIWAPRVERSNLDWEGGAVLSKLSSFSNFWVTAKDLEEHGERIFAQKIV